MKKMIGIAVFSAMTGVAFAGDGFVLNGISGKNISRAVANEISINVPEAAKSLLPGWELTAKEDLKNWLKYNGIQAKTSVVYASGKEPSLLVEFDNQQDYERIKDIFYHAPVSYPTYMGVRVSVRVPKTGNRDN